MTKCSTTSAYSSTGLPARPGCPSSSFPTTSTQTAIECSMSIGGRRRTDTFAPLQVYAVPANRSCRDAASYTPGRDAHMPKERIAQISPFALSDTFASCNRVQIVPRKQATGVAGHRKQVLFRRVPEIGWLIGHCRVGLGRCGVEDATRPYSGGKNALGRTTAPFPVAHLPPAHSQVHIGGRKIRQLSAATIQCKAPPFGIPEGLGRGTSACREVKCSASLVNS